MIRPRLQFPHALPTLALAAALGLAATSAANPAPPAATAPPATTAPARPAWTDPTGIKRFAVVEAGFYRGSRPSAEGILALKARGVRTIVSLRKDDAERARVLAAGMDYVELPMVATPFGAPVPTEAQVNAFLAVVGDPARRPVFVHCKHGRDRTGVMVALWRVARGGWPVDAAIDEMEDRGMGPQYLNYRRFIRRWTVPTGA